MTKEADRGAKSPKSAPVDMSSAAIEDRLQRMADLYALAMSLKGAQRIGRVEALRARAVDGTPDAADTALQE